MEEIQQLSHHPKGKNKIILWKIIGSILVILSGFLPFLDNIIVWFNPPFADYQNTIGGYLRNDYWLLSLYYTTVSVILGQFMNAYKLTFFFPLFASIYCSSLYLFQFVWGIKLEPEWPHRIGMILMMIPGAYIVYRLVEHINNLKLELEIQYNTIEQERNRQLNKDAKNK
ncbi:MULTISPECIES: hypothetical protein [unclassified Chryseobacterium]|uniref:hypothetical protein n=1 Tax=unclassified Chryseobacterium TaxID=2593645 RepID=UPI0028533007|nr:hypothetical protein [Chryseobacterium sp. CFS7]MDR4892233.1 hypothetical protein [Chryseobacterium sp. CFS7]